MVEATSASQKEVLENLERCLKTAKAAGCPKEQADAFVSHGYIPFPWQWNFHAACRECDRKDGPVEVGAGGSRGPGKSHAIFAQITLDDCQRMPGLKALFLRQTGRAAKESFEDLVSRVLTNKVEYQLSGSVLKFPNGSRVILGGFKDEKDIDKYVGIEYDVIGVEELNQLTESKIEKLKGSLRTSKENWRPRLYASFNPGGIGHGYVKTTFVEPYKQGLERRTRFVPAQYTANKMINVEYREYLEGLKGQLGEAWRKGNFDILAGVYFTEWREDIHVIDPFVIPSEWKRFVALDPGYTAPASMGWYAVSPTRKLYRYREVYETGLTGTGLADKFIAKTPANEHIDYIVADPAFWGTKGEDDDGLSAAEKFINRIAKAYKTGDRKLPPVIEADNDRLSGWIMLHEGLQPFEEEGGEITANFLVFSTCIKFIELFPKLIHDDNNPEDVDTDGEDHVGDEARYAVMSDPKPSRTPEQVADLHFARKMKENKQRQQRGPLLYQRRA